ncbi:MAG: HAMP domain-containing protein, partial [Betaproteobacteria bacterium]|nr:HAMP domain-containing protein [Betaproteobacteria bacterium]
ALGGAIVILGLILQGVFALFVEKAALIEDRRIKTRHLVEAAHTVIVHYQKQAAEGLLTVETAQDLAKSAVKAMRYDQKEYFWINDLGKPFPTMVMHPTVPALDGKVLGDEKFNKATSLEARKGEVVKVVNKNLFQAFVDVATESGSGFVMYDWPKPKEGGGVTEELFVKLSFVKKVEGWDWVVGTGIYIDDVDAIFWSQAKELLIFTLVVLVLMVFIIRMQTGSIVGPVNRLKAVMLKTEQTLDYSARAHVEGEDELAQMARAFNQLMATQQQAINGVNEVVNAIAAGDFSKRVEADLRGDLQVMKDAVNASAVSVKVTMEALNDVMRALYNGDFSQRMSAEVKGEVR